MDLNRGMQGIFLTLYRLFIAREQLQMAELALIHELWVRGFETGTSQRFLDMFEEQGLLVCSSGGDEPDNYEYRLTSQGRKNGERLAKARPIRRWALHVTPREAWKMADAFWARREIALKKYVGKEYLTDARHWLGAGLESVMKRYCYLDSEGECVWSEFDETRFVVVTNGTRFHRGAMRATYLPEDEVCEVTPGAWLDDLLVQLESGQVDCTYAQRQQA